MWTWLSQDNWRHAGSGMSNYVVGEREARRRSTAMEGAQLTSQDFARIFLRTRWKTVLGTIVIAVFLSAIAYALLATPPQYEAKTRLFVSTTSDSNATQTNDGGFFAQRRVLSYTQLLTGGILAQRTIDKLNLDMTANELVKEVTAEAPTDTVLIDVTVTDPPRPGHAISPTRCPTNSSRWRRRWKPPAGALRPNAQVVVQERAEIPRWSGEPEEETGPGYRVGPRRSTRHCPRNRA